MAGFYIKKVIAKSTEKSDASVTFGKGLNIIQGRSDRGKTCVANCIDFVYGGSTSKPFKDSAKHDGVMMIVASNDKPGFCRNSPSIMSEKPGRTVLRAFRPVRPWGLMTNPFSLRRRSLARETP